MKRKVDLSISIVVYRNYEDVLRAIDSIEKNTTKDIKKQIYIIDNSEFEDDNKYKKDFLSSIGENKEITYIDPHVNLGFGKGHNYILNEINSEYHAFLNPDVVLENDAFAALLNMFTDETVGMVIPRIVNQKGEILPVYRRDITVTDMLIRIFFSFMFKKRQAFHTLQDQDYDKSFDVPFGQGSFLVIRTKLLKKLEGFDERFFMYLEDADLCKRVNKVSRLVYCPEAIVMHKWEKGSHKNPKLLLTHLSSMVKYFNKWGLSF